MAHTNTTSSPQPPLGDFTLSFRRPHIAVLPFTAAGPEPEGEALAARLSEQLCERMAGDPVLQARLVRSELLDNAPPHAVELVCRILRIGHVVSGRCSANGGEASVYLELSDTRQWDVHWAAFHAGGARALLADTSGALDRMVAELRAALLASPRR